MTKEEFINDFKARIVDGVYWNMPKDYRKSREYTDKSFEDQYEQAFHHSSFKYVLESIIEEYYDEINEYEDTEDI